MEYRVELSRPAEDDLRRIFGSINADESAGAAKWFAGLESAILDLETFPERGPVTHYDATLRFLPYGNKPHIYLILYRIDHASRIAAIRHIRHGARRAPSRGR
jgi:toxin ParE1/3/4